MLPGLICSSHTISGVMPGGPKASRHDFFARVEACAAAGYTGMCLHFRDYAEQRAAGIGDASLKACLDGVGMTERSVEFLTDWFVDGEAGRVARANEEMVIEAASAFGATSINVGSDLQGRGIPRGTLRSRFRALCERAGRSGLSVALEIVAWSDVADIETALEVIDGIPNAGLVLDSWHIFRGKVPLQDLLKIPPDRVLCVQINDADEKLQGHLNVDTVHRKLCGQGSFDLQAFCQTLDAAGIKIPLSVEIISPELAAMDLRAAAKASFDTAQTVLEQFQRKSEQALYSQPR